MTKKKPPFVKRRFEKAIFIIAVYKIVYISLKNRLKKQIGSCRICG